jgi:hypothetical protein
MLEGKILTSLAAIRLDRLTPARSLGFQSSLVHEGVSLATANRAVTLIRMLLNEVRLGRTTLTTARPPVRGCQRGIEGRYNHPGLSASIRGAGWLTSTR